jgi:hypothetical protein
MHACMHGDCVCTPFYTLCASWQGLILLITGGEQHGAPTLSLRHASKQADGCM